MTAFPLPAGGGAATALAAGPSGVWFLDPSASRVGRVHASGHVVEFGGPTPASNGFANSSSLAVGPDGDAYYVPQTGNGSYLVKVTPDGSTTSIALPGSIVPDLFAGPDGVDFPLSPSGSPVPPPISFAVLGGVQIDKIGADGLVTPTSITTPNAYNAYNNSDFTFGPDGNLWFSEANPALIGRIDLVPSTEPAAGPTLVSSSIAPSRVTLAGGPTLGLFAAAGEATPLALADFRHSAGVSILSTSIDWGDGSKPTAGTLVAALGDDTTPGDNPFVDGQVSGSHAYAQAGSYTVTVTIQAVGPDGSAMTSKTTEMVSAVDPSPVPQAPPLSLEAGKSLAFEGPVAVFTTPTPHESSGADFSAMVDWGDGTPPTQETVVGGSEYSYPTGFPGGSGSNPTFSQASTPGLVNVFEVTGGHIYAKGGSFTVKVTLSDQFGHSSTESSPIQVVTGPLAVAPITPANPVSGSIYPANPSAGGTTLDLGTLTDLQGSVAGRFYAVLVDWGDGTTPDAGNVNSTGYPGLPAAGSTEDIQGTHTYAMPGKYTIHYTVGDNQGDSAKGSTTYQATASGLQLTVWPLTGNVGDPINGTSLASFTPTDASNQASDFTATVDWGDGSKPTAGTVASNSGSPNPVAPIPVAQSNPYLTPQPGGLLVSGNHTYTTPGLYTVTVIIDGPGGSTAQSTSTVSVTLSTAQTDYVDSTTPPVFTQGVASPPMPLGNLLLSAGEQASEFKATVNWGDGTPPSLATLVPGTSYQNGGPMLSILAGHDYAQAGGYTVTVSAVGADGIPDVIVNSAIVSPPLVSIVPTAPIMPIIDPDTPPTATPPTPTIPAPVPIALPAPAPAPTPAPTPVTLPVPILALKPSVAPTAAPPGPMILPSPFPRFAPTIAPAGTVVPKPSRHGSSKPTAHHVAAKAKASQLATSKEHSTTPAKPHR